VGLIDHDNVAGAHEFIEAGNLAGIGITVGMECRADFSATSLAGKRINNPDQKSIAYVVLHGIPHSELDHVTAFMKPYNEHRNTRNIEMIKRLNDLIKPYSLSIDYDKEVVPLSLYRHGGIVTERHLMFAFALKLIELFGHGSRLINFLKSDLGLNIEKKPEELLSDETNPYYAYDLLGVLKSEFLPKIYIVADKECPEIGKLAAFAKSIGAILAYPYLGDVQGSVTNDKKSQTFEDEYIGLLFEEIRHLGFNAVTYMPSRNTGEQLQRVMELCNRYGFLQISGEDINSPKQNFICMKQRDPAFAHLYDATWALIGHEIASGRKPDTGMFSPEIRDKYPDLNERIEAFKNIGLALFKNEP
jgi:hypothetical protein